ncbi:MAG: S-methyl-5'-thioadenosine phosphorylase [Candidatus Nealsonbacteria bacterium]
MPKNSLILKPKIAVIGGSGLEDPKFFKKISEVNLKTPFGPTSAPIRTVEFNGQRIAFLARHGQKHEFPPHKVPQRANIWALKKLGVETIIGVSAVGSLKKVFKPGDIVVSDQFIDFTKKRDYTFFDKETVHTSLVDPFCPKLRQLFFKEAKLLKIPIHQKGTYFCIEGPRFSTRAESKFFRNFADIIGMTLVPEAVLVREAELCYVNLSMVTDYDVWQKHPVQFEELVKTMQDNAEKINKLLTTAIPKIKEKRTCSCQNALAKAKL